MKTEKEIKQEIVKIEKDYSSVLTGALATIEENSPRALQQLSAESTLRALHWTLGTKYVSKLKEGKR